MLHVFGHQRIASGKQRGRNHHHVMDKQPIFFGDLQADIMGVRTYRHERANAAERREHLADSAGSRPRNFRSRASDSRAGDVDFNIVAFLVGDHRRAARSSHAPRHGDSVVSETLLAIHEYVHNHVSAFFGGLP